MAARWVRDPRSWGLQFCAGVCLSRAIAYFPRTNEALPYGLAAVAQVVPVWVYGLLWGATALSLLLVAVWGTKPSPMKACGLVAVPAVWASLYLAGALTAQSLRAASAAYLFWCLVGIIVCWLIVKPSASVWKAGER